LQVDLCCENAGCGHVMYRLLCLYQKYRLSNSSPPWCSNEIHVHSSAHVRLLEQSFAGAHFRLLCRRVLGDGPLGDRQPGGDGRVRVALGHQAEYPVIARLERGRLGQVDGCPVSGGR
jgi:hypothetical protein